MGRTKQTAPRAGKNASPRKRKTEEEYKKEDEKNLESIHKYVMEALAHMKELLKEEENSDREVLDKDIPISIEYAQQTWAIFDIMESSVNSLHVLMKKKFNKEPLKDAETQTEEEKEEVEV